VPRCARPRGHQPPYVLIRTGQLLVRTPTSSEPVGIHDREALDRLFARGERGRIWAREQAEALRGTEWNSQSARVVTIPAVDQGLVAIPAIFVPSFVQAMIDEMMRFHVVSSVFLDKEVQRTMSENVVGVRTPTWEDAESYLSMNVWGSGIIRSEWGRPRNGSDVQALKTMLDWALSSHRRLYETRLGHRGDVAVVALARWLDTGGGSRATFVANPTVPLDELKAPTFHDLLARGIDRSLNYYVPEPEA